MLDFIMKQAWLPWGIVIMTCLMIGAWTHVLTTPVVVLAALTILTLLPIVAYRSIIRWLPLLTPPTGPSLHTIAARIVTILETASPPDATVYWEHSADGTSGVYSHRTPGKPLHLWTVETGTSDLASSPDSIRFDNEHFYFAADGTVVRLTGHQDTRMDPEGDGHDFLAPCFDDPAHDDLAALVPTPERLQALLDHLLHATPCVIGTIT